jgi:NADH-quinone oxidoreductase subunit M
VLTLLVIAPWLGVLMVLASPRSRPALAYASAAFAGLVSVGILVSFIAVGGLPAAADRPWIEGLGLRLALHVDGFAAIHMLVAALLFLGGLLEIWSRSFATTSPELSPARPRRTLAALGLAALGLVFLAFSARDPLLFWVAQDGAAFILFTAFVMGGGRERLRTGMSFILHAAFGSLPMLVAILDLRMRLGGMDRPLSPGARELLSLGPEAQRWGLIAFLLAIATRLGLPPLQGWRRELERAPTSLRLYLAAAWVSLGSYAALRFVRPLYPEALDLSRGWLVAWGLAAMLLAGMRRLVAKTAGEREGATLAFGAAMGWVGIASGDAMAMVGGALLVLATVLALALQEMTTSSSSATPRRFAFGPQYLARASLRFCPGLFGFVAWLAIVRGVLALGLGASLVFAALSLLGVLPSANPTARVSSSRREFSGPEAGRFGVVWLSDGFAWLIGLLLLLGGLCPGSIEWIMATSFGGSFE